MKASLIRFHSPLRPSGSPRSPMKNDCARSSRSSRRTRGPDPRAPATSGRRRSCKGSSCGRSRPRVPTSCGWRRSSAAGRCRSSGPGTPAPGPGRRWRCCCRSGCRRCGRRSARRSATGCRRRSSSPRSCARRWRRSARAGRRVGVRPTQLVASGCASPRPQGPSSLPLLPEALNRSPTRGRRGWCASAGPRPAPRCPGRSRSSRR